MMAVEVNISPPQIFEKSQEFRSVTGLIAEAERTEPTFVLGVNDDGLEGIRTSIHQSPYPENIIVIVPRADALPKAYTIWQLQ